MVWTLTWASVMVSIYWLGFQSWSEIQTLNSALNSNSVVSPALNRWFRFHGPSYIFQISVMLWIMIWDMIWVTFWVLFNMTEFWQRLHLFLPIFHLHFHVDPNPRKVIHILPQTSWLVLLMVLIRLIFIVVKNHFKTCINSHELKMFDQIWSFGRETYDHVTMYGRTQETCHTVTLH